MEQRHCAVCVNAELIMSNNPGVHVEVHCSSTLPLRRPAAFWDAVILCFDVRGEHTAMQHNNDSQLIWLYCVLCSTIRKKRKKEREKKPHLICKRKIYAKLKSMFNTVGLKGEQESWGHKFPYEIKHSCFLSHEKRSRTDEGINSFTLGTFLAVMMKVGD